MFCRTICGRNFRPQIEVLDAAHGKRYKKDIIHAKGYDIGIYTTDYENEFISLTDIAKYKINDPNDVGLPMYDAPNAVEELKQPRKHLT